MWKPEHVITQVQASDAKMRQVVLTVKEPKTTFVVEVPKYMVNPRDKVLRTFKNGRTVEVERQTPEGTRHFLCGVDERNHPFIAQLSRAATSIKAAHELLKPAEVRGMQVKGHGKNSKVKARNKKAVLRQGEWFLIPLNITEQAEIEAYAKKHGVVRNQPLGGRGKPHTADETILMPLKKPAVGNPQLYMRGKLRHVEHDTLDFPHWVKVIRNLEAGGATAGATWVD
jgi:hypothetical protein